MSQTELSVKWWQYVYNIPTPDNPFFFDENNDRQGGKAQTNQIPPVFYAVGKFGESVDIPSDEIIRNVKLAPNQGYEYFFIPLINNQWDNVQLPGFSDRQIKGLTQAVADTALERNGGNLSLFIDDVEIQGLERYRQQSQKFFYNLPNDNILGLDSQIVRNAYADGFHATIKLAALSPESHTFEFGGTFNLRNLDIPDNLNLEDLEEEFKSAEEVSQNITYNISFDLNPIRGTNINDSLFGTSGWDKINGRAGDDYIVGLEGNDDIYGGRGNDILVGVNPFTNKPGKGEIDILNGGVGQDTFVLGNEQNVFYRGNRLEDYAIIRDFNTEDKIQLYGNRRLYELDTNYSLGNKEGTAIFLRNTTELIGFVENVTNLNLVTNDFSFVS
ncbi:hypothetical protein [Anabaena sp. UHCC 0451]|uniref:calcium-binding protein n=1 Tax=Anabaena sp. UHCC 0451 TaxID=2055235 RepID=UPI002B1FEDBA|nr:hypothetical protein [Anabaena sp. UHCC 0451]MEA5578700.1 hypothetical protein [Anabaena sp. UHCC 0451]